MMTDQVCWPLLKRNKLDILLTKEHAELLSHAHMDLMVISLSSTKPMTSVMDHQLRKETEIIHMSRERYISSIEKVSRRYWFQFSNAKILTKTRREMRSLVSKFGMPSQAWSKYLRRTE